MANSNQDSQVGTNAPPLIWTEETAILRRADGKTQCQICGREFTTLPNGKRHYRTSHMEVTPFECIFCRKMVKNDAVYGTHLKTKHDVTKKQVKDAQKIEMDGQDDYLLVISEKNVLCVTSAGCNAKFTTIPSAKRHYNTKGPNHQGKNSNPDNEQ
jgi:hypothetical protein